MTPDRWRVVTDIFHSALAQDAADCAAFVAAACKGDASLRAEVEALLDAHRKAGSFGDTPILVRRAEPLATGTLLAWYRIEALIGSGGMGEVYRATDTRLGRTVAIKTLPVHLRDFPDVQARFEREARTVSQLTHPHICTLHDIGHEDGIDFLVMEHLEGETLAARLNRATMPLEQVLRIGIEIASAIDHAHRHDVIHRDLKPANVILTKSGAKLLDFGLAKLCHSEVVSATSSPMVEDSDTRAGTLLGTVPYMSPEQLDGKEADARSDIWALGCVLYEMAARRRAFDSPSKAGLIAAILEGHPEPLERVQPLSPPALGRVIRTCLARDPDERWQSAADLTRELEWIALDSRAAATHDRPRLRFRGLAVSLVIGFVALAGAWISRVLTTAERATVYASFDVAPAEEIYGGPPTRSLSITAGGSHTALSWTPDGRALVFAGFGPGPQQLYIRSLGHSRSDPIAGTEGAYVPVVSADGQWVAFWSAGAIRKVSLTGGASTVLVPDVTAMPMGMSWNAAGLLYSDGRRIWHAPPGTQPTAVTTPEDPERGHILPSWLPDGKAFVYTVRRRVTTWGHEQTVIQTLATAQRRVLLEDAIDVRVAAGALLFMRMGTLYVAPFDASRHQLRGEPTAVLPGVSQAVRGLTTESHTGAGQFAVSPDGSLAYVEGEVPPFSQSRVVTVDLKGNVAPAPVPAGPYRGFLRLSRDGRQIVTVVDGLTEVSLLVIDRNRGARTTLTRKDEFWWPLWMPDSRWIVALRHSDEAEDVVIQPADGSHPPEHIADGPFDPASASPDGRYILGLKNADVWVLDRTGQGPRLRPVVESPLEERWPVFSPDGRWFAYGSYDGNHSEIYVQAFPASGGRAQVSVNRGSNVAWNPNGRELFFVRRADKVGAQSGAEGRPMQMLAARVENGIPMGSPRVLFEFRPEDLPGLACFPLRCFDVAPDGKSFYVLQPPPMSPAAPVERVQLVTNWMREVNSRLSTTR